MTKPKAINLFLLDGNTTGRIKCTIGNWVGIAYKIPRNKLEECKNGDNLICSHLKQTGIYFLLGENQDGNLSVYVGQSNIRRNGEGLLNRLLEHKRNDKESYYNDWNEVVCFTSQNDSLGATDISYLESKFTTLAKSCKRYTVNNGNEPNIGNITEEKESTLEEFIEYACMAIGVLGHKVFEPIIENTINDSLSNNFSSLTFYYQGKYKAQGIITNEGFVLLKNSEISNTLTPSIGKNTIRNREKYKNKIDVNYITTDDLLFTSPSAAASFVAGSPQSGNILWKTLNNKSPKDY